LSQSAKTRDPFCLHRLALRPLIGDKDGIITNEILHTIQLTDAERFLSFLRWHGLAPLWFEVLTGTPDLATTGTYLMQHLHQDKLDAVAAYMLQKRTLEKLHQIFTGAEIPYAIFKGVQVREMVYPQPALRPACDIDVLVSGSQRNEAIKVLAEAGMKTVIKPQNLSHECTLMDNNVAVDLHWHIMRPGRIPPELSDQLLLDRVVLNGFSGLNECATIFVLLVHPAYTRYVCNPYALLIRSVDLIRLFREHAVDWDRVMDLVTRAHARTAAWSTLFWLNLLAGTGPAMEIMNRLAPPRIKRSYLEFWIRNNLPFRFETWKMLMHPAFTLALHDNIGDAVTAVKHRINWGQSRINSKKV
jgi:hypothetical protein